MTDSLVLAGDFDAPGRQDWEAEVLKVLNRKRPPGTEIPIDKAMARLRTATVDGLVIEPLYTADDAPASAGGRTRASHAPSGTAWDIRALHEDGDVATTNAAILDDLAKGATSLWLVTGEGAIATNRLPDALAGVRADLAPVAVTSTDDPEAAAEALLAWFAAAGAGNGNLGVDPLAHAAATGTPADLGGLVGWVDRVADHPGVKPYVVDVRVYDEAGAGDVDQLAFAVATGIAYARALAEAGIAAEKAFGLIDFRVTANADQFTTIARLRALRRLWARVGEVLDVPEAARGAVQHAVTSRRMVTRDDPWVNLLRGTIATFSAAVGGAEQITTLPYDDAHGLPSAFSRRMARNTQLVAAEESNLYRVADPAGGSWYVESLTDQVATKAWARVQEIEAAGGMAEALASGMVTQWIAAVVSERGKRLATRRQPITGVSMFPLAIEAKPEGTKPRPAPLHRGGLQAVRDSEVYEALRDRSARRTALTGTQPGVFLACLGARRDFGPRETFTSNLLLAGGLAHPSAENTDAEGYVAAAKAAGTPMVILCSSAKQYAAKAVEVATALKAAGIAHVWIAGRTTEIGPSTGSGTDVEQIIDGEVYDGMDVVAFLSDTLDRLGVAK